MKNHATAIFYFCLVLFLASCGYTSKYKSSLVLRTPTIIKSYPGDLKPLSESGLLVPDIAMTIVSIDGKKTDQFEKYARKSNLFYGEGKLVSLLPGEHAAEVCFALYDGKTTTFCRDNLLAKINIKAGEIQMLSFKGQDRGWTFFIQDPEQSRADIIFDYQEALKYKK